MVRARIASELLLCYALQCMYVQPAILFITFDSAYHLIVITIVVMVTVVDSGGQYGVINRGCGVEIISYRHIYVYI